MKIIIDGDACPSKDIVKALGKRFALEVHVFVDSSHYFEDDYFKMHVVSKGKDAVDIALVNFMDRGDLIITQDYGLASMALTKTEYVVNPLGFCYTPKNIDELLFKRHIAQNPAVPEKAQQKNKKRTSENDVQFHDVLERILLHSAKQ